MDSCTWFWSSRAHIYIYTYIIYFPEVLVVLELRRIDGEAYNGRVHVRLSDALFSVYKMEFVGPVPPFDGVGIVYTRVMGLVFSVRTLRVCVRFRVVVQLASWCIPTNIKG